MDWECPGYSVVMQDQLQILHGNLTPENAISYVTPIVETGNLLVAVYDLSDEVIYVSNARGTGEEGAKYAFDR